MAKKATITKNKYNKTHTKQFLLVYHNVYDADIIETLSSVPNRNDFIRQLIRDYNTRTGSVPEGMQAKTVVIYEPIDTPPVPKTKKKEG